MKKICFRSLTDLAEFWKEMFGGYDPVNFFKDYISSRSNCYLFCVKINQSN